MTELLILRGLPASGKSTYAKAWVAADPGSRIRVNRDGIRWTQGIREGVGTREEEEKVTLIEEAMVKAGLAAGKSVVVDAMHLAARYVRKWAKIHPVTIKDFEVDLDVLYERDRSRIERGERGVGVKVLLDIANRYGIKQEGKLPKLPYLGDLAAPTDFKPYVPGKIRAYSFDIDGTLAQMNGRGPYDTSLYHTDVADGALSEILWALQDAERHNEDAASFIVMSGRSDEFKPVLIEWLKGWGLDFDPDLIFMRKAGDLRNDAIIKSEIVDNHISGVYDVIAHFDDRNRVVDALRAKGMKVLQVAPGDF